MKKKLNFRFKTFIFILLFSVLSLFFFNNKKIYIINDDLMGNTLKKDSITIGSKDKKNIKRYQIVGFEVNGKKITKRIIGLPNEKIEIYYRDIYYDDIKSFDMFITGKMPVISEKTTFNLSDDLYFVIGDNREYFNINNLKKHPEEYFISKDDVKILIDSDITIDGKKIGNKVE